MDMHDLNMSILTQLNDINKDVGNFSVGVLSNDISHDDQIAFAHRLVDLAKPIVACQCDVPEYEDAHHPTARRRPQAPLRDVARGAH